MIDRIFFHYEDLEEYHNGMWKRPTGVTRKDFIDYASDLMRCPDEFKLAMKDACDKWPNSCAHNLTCLDNNRIAWLGHAGCCIATGSPEECTRVAWHTLTSDEQDEANRVAAEILHDWETEHEAKECSRNQLVLTFCPPLARELSGRSKNSSVST